MGLLDAFLDGADEHHDSGSAAPVDASSVLSMVGHLISGDEKTTGAASGIINPSVLMSEIGKLTGMKTTDHAAEKSSGLDGNMIMSLVSNLAKGGEKETGAKEGSISPHLLSGVLSSFTGKNGFNAGSMAAAIAPLLKNAEFNADFMKNPIKAIEKVIGIDLPDEKLQPLIDNLKAKLGHQQQNIPNSK